MPGDADVHISVRSLRDHHRSSRKIRCIPAEGASLPHSTSVGEQHMDHTKFPNYEVGR